MKLVSVLLAVFLVATSSAAKAQTFNAGYSAPWFTQLGITAATENSANGGNGFTIGIVDTGIITTNAEVAGRVAAASSCAAVTFNCSAGVKDDHGHGTATASIAAGSTATGGWMSGVAPKATIVAEKVLNASGSGYDVDVANGITKAANAGAGVINLSLTYTPTAAIVNAINYAASKGAIVVFAGGNSAAALNGGANSNGFSTAALSRIVFVGSVNSSNKLSSFSNTPGTGSAISGSVRKSYSSLWLMAAGENIVAPGIMYGANAYAYWTGTSMAAPEVTGSLALLETTWPVLARNGTATSVLFQSATDLGSAGVDNTYGNGLLNLTKAFQPIGTLTVTKTNGQSIAVSSLSGSVLSSGALGSLSSISSKLSNYTSFDSYQRNFSVNLSGLIAAKPSSASQVTSAAQAPVVSAYHAFTDGASFAYAYTESASNAGGASMPNRAWYSEFTNSSGTTLATGHGFAATNSFADTMWGFDSKTADATRILGVSNAVIKLADGGDYFAYGGKIGDASRVAFSFANTGASNKDPFALTWQTPNANAFGTGFTTQLADFGDGRAWNAGFTFGYLTEDNGLLGTVYDSNGLVSLGNKHNSMSWGFSSSLDLSNSTGLLFEAALSRTDGGAVDSGLVSNVSSILARSYGASLVTKDAFRDNDHLTLSLKKPLRVISGGADIATTDVDSNGYATTSTTRVGLTPTGSETSFGMNYDALLNSNLSLTASTTFSQDAENVSGATAAAARVGLKLSF